MYAISDGDVRCVAKEVQKWQSGDISYRVTLSDGESAMLTCDTEESIYQDIKPFEVVYDCEIEIRTTGYKTYATLTGAKAR